MSGLFGGSDKNYNPAATAAPVAPIIAPPVVTPQATMPDDSSPEVREANRRAQMAAMNRAGRTSTILTAPSGRGNSRQSTDTYANRTLGGA